MGNGLVSSIDEVEPAGSDNGERKEEISIDKSKIARNTERKDLDSLISIDKSKMTISIIAQINPFCQSGQLSEQQKQFWQKHGLLLVSHKDIFDTENNPSTLQSIIDEIVEATHCQERVDGPWMYFNMQTIKDDASEKTGDASNRILSRIERVCEHYPILNKTFNDGPISKMINQLFGETGVLYKEKINLKLPNDSGFEAHQDYAAGWWMHGHSYHISAFMAIDECTIENGCLQAVLNWGADNHDLLSEKFKGIPKYAENSFDWYNLLMKPGDILFFTSFIPHRSFVNQTDKPRRVLIGTWNKLSEGNKRNEYYNDKQKSFPPDIIRNKDKKYGYKI